jgi:3-hydroxyacyl-CoA dehydrogenase
MLKLQRQWIVKLFPKRKGIWGIPIDFSTVARSNQMVVAEAYDGVTVVKIDNPPVNALGAGIPEGLEKAIKAAEADGAVRAIVILGAGTTFVAGADIKQLEDLAWGRGSGAPNIHTLLLKIENCTKPIIMAIHGTALGGGLELAMAGHYRVAVRSARVGQPEVNLGIIPGAEGTQRLPRLAGVEKAIEMCVTGRLLSAPEALEAGIIDKVVEGDLQSEAIVYARHIAEKSGPYPHTQEQTAVLKHSPSLEDALQAGAELARKLKRNQIAPLKVLEAIRAAALQPFEEGCAREQQLFHECATSDQCRALIHGFFAERAVTKIPGVSRQAAALPIEQVFVVGAGTMGRSIAMACANAGLKVALRDASPEALEAAMLAIRKNYDSSIQRGRLTPDMGVERLGRIRPQLDHQGIETADLVIEAVFEDLELKRSVFRELDRILKPSCILASNTSTLSIDELARVTGRPDRILGLHFFSPAHVMRLLEIVRGQKTSSHVLATALALAKRLSKVGVVVRNCPGFVANRLMFPYMYEAQFLLEEGATPEQVDRALHNFGMAMGIFEVEDMAGLDIAWRVRRALHQFSAPGERKPLVADALCKMGRFGQKNGKGWYVYGEDGKPSPDPEVQELIRSLSRKAALPQQQFTDDEIVERTLYGLINEGARVLEEGSALRASDIDVIYVNGYGFPAWRGGPMFHADSVGLGRIVERISSFEHEFGARWKVSPLLQRLAESGKTFRSFDEEQRAKGEQA